MLAAVPMGTRWVPFCVMALTGSWCWPSGPCCKIVTVVNGAAWELWMMRLTPPIEVAVMDGTDSTFTVKIRSKKKQNNKCDKKVNK